MNVYRIGVNIAMTSNGAQLLGLLGRELLGVHAKVKDLQGGFNRLKLAMVGALSVSAGVAILGAFKAPLEEARKYQTELARFKQFGMADNINAAADRYARATVVMGASARDMMHNMVEAQGVFRESGALTMAQALVGAKIAAPILSKIDFANAGLNPDDQERFHNQNLMMLRFIESRGGANDPSTFARIADWGFKLITSSGGNINWDQLRGLVKTAGAAGFNLKEDAISRLEPVVTDMGGGTVGSGLRVAYQRLMGTQRGLPKQAVAEYLSLGAWNPSKVELTGGGGVKRFLGNPGAVMRDRDKFATDPVAYYTENFLPMIAKKYGKQILGDTVQAKTERAAEISMFFGPGTAGNLFSQIDKLLPAIQRSVAAQKNALGIDASDKNVAGTLAGKEIMLQKNWQTLMLQLGDQVLPLAIRGMTFLNDALTKFNAWALKNPGKIELFAKLAISVAAGLVALGGAAVGVAIFTGGWVGAVVAGIGALVAGFTAWAVFNWGSLKAAASAMGNFVSGIFHIAAVILDHVAKFFSMTPGGKLPHGVAPDFNPWLPAKPVSPPGANGNRPSAAPGKPMAPTKSSYVIPLNVDGRQLAEALLVHQSDALDRASLAGSGNFDPSMTLAPTGLGYA